MRGTVRNMPICQVCGKANADDARFCFSCGATLSQAPPVKVEVKSPVTGYTKPTPPAPMAPSTFTTRPMQRPGSCYYHPELPSGFVCARCGRSVCAGCSRQYGALSLCTECFWGLSSKLGYWFGQYPMESPQQGRSPLSVF